MVAEIVVVALVVAILEPWRLFLLSLLWALEAVLRAQMLFLLNLNLEKVAHLPERRLHEKGYMMHKKPLLHGPHHRFLHRDA